MSGHDPPAMDGPAHAVLHFHGSLSASRFVSVSPACCELLGFESRELCARSFRVLQGPCTDVRGLEDFLAAGGGDGMGRVCECTLYTKAGTAAMLRLEGDLRFGDRSDGFKILLHLRFILVQPVPCEAGQGRLKDAEDEIRRLRHLLRAIRLLPGSERASTVPETCACVSVLFADVVGFTVLSGTMDATAVAGLLRRLFDRFDVLAKRHGVLPVDRIGDAYLAATNLMGEQPMDHAASLARFALTLSAAAAAVGIDPEGGEGVRVRVGMHTGPAAVVSDWAGSKGRLTLLGDTVNVASRMESTGYPGRVQCSADMAALLAVQAPDIRLCCRLGGVDVKGKGRMHTFWVDHEKAA